MDFTVKGKVALVTGASRGIGEATALGLARMGADVAVTSRKLPELERVVEEIKGLGRKSIAVPSHIGKIEEIDNLVKTLKEKFGKIDILVNNAGANPTMASALDIEERAWDVIMNLNLKGLFFLSQAVARIMKEQGGGNIINVSSLHGVKPSCLLPVYSISKAGVIAVTKVMAGEWAKYNIRVNAVAPGLIKTKFSEALWSNEEMLKDAMKKTPVARMGTPEDIATAIVYLASDASSYVNGEVLVVDGGSTI